MVKNHPYKWSAKVWDSSVVSGSSAVRIEESFDSGEWVQFDQFQKNLMILKEKVFQLSFMVNEVQDVLEQTQTSVDVARGS